MRCPVLIWNRYFGETRAAYCPYCEEYLTSVWAVWMPDEDGNEIMGSLCPECREEFDEYFEVLWIDRPTRDGSFLHPHPRKCLNMDDKVKTLFRWDAYFYNGMPGARSIYCYVNDILEKEAQNA